VKFFTMAGYSDYVVNKGRIVGVGILIGYFAKQDEARKALRDLARKGFNRTALVHKGTDGDVHITDPFFRRRIFGAILAAILSGTIGGLAVLLRHWTQALPDLTFPTSPVIILGCAAIGGLAALLWLRRSRFGVEPGVIRNHARWLVSGESVLILQAPVESLQRPVVMLRESSDLHPALFVMHPKRERRIKERKIATKLSPTQIREHARRHAGEQLLDPKPQHTSELLNRLRQSRQWVRQVCADLGAASRLEQKATPAADWILDNEYILEGNARDVLLNLPRRFYRQLPTLASDPYRGLPCIYGLAKDLVTHTELRLDRENILAFIEAYQSVRTLTIGELWAIPQMLRIALIESIQSLAVTALANLRERQLAEFWANRLINANRRDSNQLFAILAELAAAEPSPSPYFGTQLIGLLYDEAAALSPVQSWLERTLKNPLHDINLREQNRQTREQISCGNAFTSLRQLALLDWREFFEKLSQVEQILRRDPSGVYAGMDFATRDRCRRAIEELARAAGRTEEQVAERVISLATQAQRQATTDDRRCHVGTWLIGEGRAELARLLACRETYRYRLLDWIYRHHAGVYAFGIGGFSAVFIIDRIGGTRGLMGPIGLIVLTLLLLIPVSQLAIEMVNYLVTRVLPTRPWPRWISRKRGFPMLPHPGGGADDAGEPGDHPGRGREAGDPLPGQQENNLLFSLFTDYTDAATPCEEDRPACFESRANVWKSSTTRHGGERFYLLHRERTWSESEQLFIGWERKRGKLEELNRLIDGTRPEPPLLVTVVGSGSAWRTSVSSSPWTAIPSCRTPRPAHGRNPGTSPQSAPLRRRGQHHGRLYTPSSSRG
jgi:cyclic beta-1,2-glucan synthetase